MSRVDLKRDRQVTREIHKLFWRANFDTPRYFLGTILLHPPAMFLIHVYIPVQAAYGIQSIVKGDFHQTNHYAWSIVIAMLVAQAIFSLATVFFDRLGTHAGAYVQRSVFASFLEKDYEFYSNQFIGGLGTQSSKLRDAAEEYDRIIIFESMKSGIIVIFGTAVIAKQSWILAAYIILGVVLAYVATVGISILRLKYRRRLSYASNQLAASMGDSLSHGATVKSYAKERVELKRNEILIKNWMKAQLDAWDSSIPVTFIRHMLLAIIMAVLLVVSAHQYQIGAISIAMVALVQLYLIRIANVTLDISDHIKKYEALMTNAYEPVATMLISVEVKDSEQPKELPSQTSYGVRFQNVSYKYPESGPGTNAISDFNLDIKPGERIGLVGHSGGGKTTLTKLVLRFMDVTEGSIEVGGIDIKEIKQADLREQIAYVPQEPLLFHRTIRENILYANPKADNDAFIQAAATAYVDEFVDELPNGYETTVGERGVKLSGGQRQRVAVARALLKNAPILVLDEATSALDSQSEQYVQKALWQLMKGRTVLVIAHRLSTIQHLDRIVVIDGGQIAEIGTHQQLLTAKDGIYATLWQHQSGGYLAND